jgi:hypothetical protein
MIRLKLTACVLRRREIGSRQNQNLSRSNAKFLNGFSVAQRLPLALLNASIGAPPNLVYLQSEVVDCDPTVNSPAKLFMFIFSHIPLYIETYTLNTS